MDKKKALGIALAVKRRKKSQGEPQHLALGGFAKLAGAGLAGAGLGYMGGKYAEKHNRKAQVQHAFRTSYARVKGKNLAENRYPKMKRMAEGGEVEPKHYAKGGFAHKQGAAMKSAGLATLEGIPNAILAHRLAGHLGASKTGKLGAALGVGAASAIASHLYHSRKSGKGGKKHFAQGGEVDDPNEKEVDDEDDSELVQAHPQDDSEEDLTEEEKRRTRLSQVLEKVRARHHGKSA